MDELATAAFVTMLLTIAALILYFIGSFWK